MDDIIKYNSLNESILNYNFNQLFSYFSFICSYRNTFSAVFEHQTFRYFLYVEPTTNIIVCYDLNLNQTVSKVKLFLTHFYSLNYFDIKSAIENNSIPLTKEVELTEPKNFVQALAIYYKNFPFSYFKTLPVSETFKSFSENPAITNHITYNKELNKFSFPLFSDGEFSPCDFLDFDRNGYSKRFNSEFSLWYSKKPSKAYITKTIDFIDEDNPEDETENFASLSFNPAALLSSLTFYQSNIKANFFHLIFSEPFSTFYFTRFISLFNSKKNGGGVLSADIKNLFHFDKIYLIYDIAPSNSFHDLFSLMKFCCASLNYLHNDFTMEVDTIKYNYIKVVFFNYPSTFKYLQFQTLVDSFNSALHDKYCGKANPNYMAGEITANIDFIKDYTFFLTKYTNPISKRTTFILTFPAKAEFIVIFLNYLIQTYMPVFELVNINAGGIFYDTPV